MSGEVPEAGGARGREDLNCDQEGNDPDEAEEHVDHHVVALVGVLDGGNETELIIFWGSKAINENCSGSPPEDNWDAENVHNNWEESNLLVLGQEFTGCFHNGGSESDTFPEAADEDHVKGDNDPDDSSTTYSNLVLVGSSILNFHYFFICKISSGNTQHKNDQEGCVNKRLGDALKQPNI